MPYPISRYLNIRSAYGPTISGDGSRLAFLTNITGAPQVWRVKLGDNLETARWPDQLTFDIDRAIGAWYSPLNGDTRLIYAYDVGGDENCQLHLLAADGGTVTPLTAGFENAFHIFGCWTDDGHSILFAANRRHPGLFDLYLQPLDGEAHLVWQNETPGYLFDMTVSPDGRYAALCRMISYSQCDLLEIDLSTGEMRQLSPTADEVFFGRVYYSSDGRSVFTITDWESDFFQIARLDRESGHLEILVTLDWDIDNLALSPDGRYLAFAVNAGGDYSLHLYDLESRMTRSAPELGESPGVAASFFEKIIFSPDGKRLAFSFSSSTRTGDIFIWDLEEDLVQAVTRSSHGGLPRSAFVDPQLIHYPTFDTDESGEPRQIPAWFYKPAIEEDKRLPVVLIMHGGPESQAQPYFSFLIQFLINNGYSVLAPNVRGSTGYGKAYSHLDDVEKRMDSVADMAYAAYWLKAQPDVDGDRLVAYGGSYGGFMVLGALTAYPDLWAAGVNIVGISNFVTFLENTSVYRRRHREAEYGSLERDREFLERISPLNHIDKIAAPLMIIHGENDPRVPASEAVQLAAGLEEKDVPVEMLMFDDEGHGIAKLKNKLIAYPAIVDFLQKYV